MNGDKYKTGKVTPGGKPDPSIFSTSFNPEGIQVGTAISLLVRREQHAEANAVKFRHFWGKSKKEDLLDSLKDEGDAGEHSYVELAPAVELGLPFMPLQFEASYFDWPLLPELFPTSFPGVKTSRDDVVVDIGRERLIERMEKYFDPNVSHEEMRRIAPGVMEDSARFQAESTRNRLCKRGFLPENIVRYHYRPLDMRWLYYEPETKLLDEKRTEYFAQVFEGNLFIEARQKSSKEDFDRGLVTKNLADNLGSGLSNYFPLLLQPASQRKDLFSEHDKQDNDNTPHPNLSDAALQYLVSVDTSNEYESLFFHIVAVLHAPAYRTENAGALRQNFPRVPLPATRESLEASAALGRQIAQLLDTETTVAGVTGGAIRPELRSIAVLRRTDGAGALNPQAGDLELRAGWGHKGKANVVMPGKGRVHTRDYTTQEREALQSATTALGAETHDIFLNETACWSNVPSRVWDYTIGGYQVIKKWLSYREQEILGRSLTSEEAREVTQTARRIAAILLLETELNANYERVKAACYAWK
jgi:hypothetical protein